MRSCFALLLLAAVSACASSATEVRGPDGQLGWYSITCRRNQGNCYEAAGEVCPRGYEMADAQARQGFYAEANRYGASAGSTYRGEMLIKCKP